MLERLAVLIHCSGFLPDFGQKRLPLHPLLCCILQLAYDQSLAFNLGADDLHSLPWGTAAGTLTLDCLNGSLTAADSSKNDVSAIKPSSGNSGDEELRTIGVGTSISHGQAEGLVLELEVFVFEAPAIDGTASGTVRVGEISALDHEVGNDSVENGVLVTVDQSIFINVSTLAELYEVLHCLGSHFSEQVNDNLAVVSTADFDAQGDLMGDNFLSRMLMLTSLRAAMEMATRANNNTCAFIVKNNKDGANAPH